MIDLDTRFATLTELVDSTPAKELEEALGRQPGGPDGVLDVIFAKLASLINPEKVGDSTATFQYEVVTAAERLPYFLVVNGGSCEVGRGVRENANVVITVKIADLAQMAAGKLSGRRAFVTGRLKLRGDPMLGMKLGQWFKLA